MPSKLAHVVRALVGLAAVCSFDCGGVLLGEDAGAEAGRPDAALDGHIPLDGSEGGRSPSDGALLSDGDAALGQGCPPAGHVFEPSDPCDWTGVCSIGMALCGPVQQFLATCPDGHIGIDTGSPRHAPTSEQA